jgi:hypothetical protein
MIHLFAGGTSIMKVNFKELEGLKVFINFAFKHYPEHIDVLIWGDDFVGDSIIDDFEKKPPFKMVCHRGNGGFAARRGWIDEIFEYPKANFTLVWALYWIKEKYPNEQIIIYGLDGDGADYYDGWVIKGQPQLHSENKPLEEKIKAIARCYKNLDEFEQRENIYVTKNSAYRGFPEW